MSEPMRGRVQEIVAHPGIDQIFPASVSREAKDLDDLVQACILRPIGLAVPYLFVDASHYQIRDGAQYVTKAVAGVQEAGYREILDASVTDCENEEFWSGLIEPLTERRLTEVQLVISDGHTGIQKAAQSPSSTHPGRHRRYIAFS